MVMLTNREVMKYPGEERYSLIAYKQDSPATLINEQQGNLEIYLNGVYLLKMDKPPAFVFT